MITKSLHASRLRIKNCARPRLWLLLGKRLLKYMMALHSTMMIKGKTLQKLGEFCVNTTNEIYERYVFNKRDQGVRKSIDAYTASLRSLIKTCSYDALTDNLNRDHMVVGILDKVIRKKLLQESKLTLQGCIDICRPNECTKCKKKPKVDQRNSKGDLPSDKLHKQIDY